MKFIITEKQNDLLLEVRVPREERIELLRDENLIIVVP
jgi:hypothetical protein